MWKNNLIFIVSQKEEFDLYSLSIICSAYKTQDKLCQSQLLWRIQSCLWQLMLTFWQRKLQGKVFPFFIALAGWVEVVREGAAAIPFLQHYTSLRAHLAQLAYLLLTLGLWNVWEDLSSSSTTAEVFLDGRRDRRNRLHEPFTMNISQGIKVPRIV